MSRSVPGLRIERWRGGIPAQQIMACRTVAGTLGAFLALSGLAAGQTPSAAAADWRGVDTLRPGTPIVVTLASGEERTGRFVRSAADEVVIDVAGRGATDVREELTPKARIATVATHDPAADGLQIGALVGGGAALAMFQAGASACGIGCENDLPGAGVAFAGAFGAGVGSAVGFLVDRLRDRSEILYPPQSDRLPRGARESNAFFPDRAAVRVGAAYTATRFHSSLVHGSAAAPGFAVAGQVAPYVSLHAEYTARGARLYPSPGEVPDFVRQNVVPASARVAGRSYGIESTRVTFVFSELVGVHPPPWGRFRAELLAGLSVRGQEDRDYYDAWRQLGQGTAGDPLRHERIAGKYYVLDFESPEGGVILGADAELAVSHRLRVVPTIRYTRTTHPGPAIAYGVGAHWRF
jgi:hypothetical protein